MVRRFFWALTARFTRATSVSPSRQWPVSAAEQLVDAAGVDPAHLDGAGEAPGPARRLLLQVVAHSGLLGDDLAAPGHLDPLAHARVALHLRHRNLSFYYGSARQGATDGSAIGHRYEPGCGTHRRPVADRPVSGAAIAAPQAVRGLYLLLGRGGLGAWRLVRSGFAFLGGHPAAGGRGGLGGPVGRDHHDHVTAVLLRCGFHEPQLSDLFRELAQEPETQLRPALFATAEHDRHLDLVARPEEPDHVTLL